MCFDPISLGIGFGTIAQIAGVGASVVGTVVGAQAQSQAYKASEVQNKNNAIIAQRNAEDARTRGVVAQQDVQLRNRARLGQQKNALSEKNIAVSEGSALDILGDTAMFGKLDELTTRNNFEREAIASETQRYNFDAQAEQDRMAARNAKTAGTISAFSTALGGIGDIYTSKKRGIGFGN